MGKGRTGSSRSVMPRAGTSGAQPPRADARAASPFVELGALLPKLRPTDDKPAADPAAVRKAARPPSPAAATAADPAPVEDDAGLFRQAVGQVAPIRAQGRARIEHPKPPPLPRPRHEAPAPDAPPTGRARGSTGPQSDAELFRAAVGDVTPVRDGGRVHLEHVATARYRQASHAPREDFAATQAGPPGADDGKTGSPVLPPLSDTDAAGELFRHAVGAVEPLPDRNLARIDRPRPPPQPRQTEADEQAVLQEAISAPLSFEDRLDMGDEAAFLRDGIPRRVLTDLRRGRWVVQGELDLHGLTREEARDALGGFLADALQHGRRCLRLIHGKGLGSPRQEPVLKHLSRTWLARREDILAFCQARPQDGGEGALLILLRAPRGDRAPAASPDDR